MDKEKQSFEMNCFRRSIMYTRRRIEDMRKRAYIMRLSRNWRNVYREFVKKDAEIADLREKLQNMRIRSDTFEDKNIDKDVDIDELKSERDEWKKRAYDLGNFVDEQKLELALLDQTNMELKAEIGRLQESVSMLREDRDGWKAFCAQERDEVIKWKRQAHASTDFTDTQALIHKKEIEQLKAEIERMNNLIREASSQLPDLPKEWGNIPMARMLLVKALSKNKQALP